MDVGQPAKSSRPRRAAQRENQHQYYSAWQNFLGTWAPSSAHSQHSASPLKLRTSFPPGCRPTISQLTVELSNMPCCALTAQEVEAAHGSALNSPTTKQQSVAWAVRCTCRH